jgi:D-alanine-D-alanine ligase
MNGYSRIDWRINQEGEAVFLEANPNPALAQDDDFAKAAKKNGITYQELIMNLIQLALTKAGRKSVKVLGNEAV